MNKVLKRIIRCSIFGVVALILLCCSFISFDGVSKIVNAEEGIERESFTLISPLYNATPSETLEKYNIQTAQTSGFTPFDIKNKQRMEGMSFTFETTEKNQIENKVVYVDDVSNISAAKEYSLKMWIYFDNIYLHDLTLALKFENNSELVWTLSANTLYGFLSYSGSPTFDELPYGWCEFELPFQKAEMRGEIDDGDFIYAPKEIKVNYTSPIAELDNFANLKFYDLKLIETNNTSSYTINEQGFRGYSFNFFPTELLNSLCVGDSVKIPAFNNAVDYAWNGEVDLTDSRLTSIAWKVKLKEPDKGNQITTLSFGDTINFNNEGVYQLYYQCIDTTEEMNEPIISASITIDVRVLKAVYFNKINSNIEVGKTYILRVSSSSLFSSVSDFTFTSSSEMFEVEYKGNGVVAVTAKAEGDFELSASISGSRVASPQEKEYSTKISFKATAVKDKNKVTKIVLWSVLGAFGVALIIIGIKTLVKARKFDVK